MRYIPIFINVAVLIYGGVVDFRHREIPNAVPILLLVSGIVGFSVIRSMLGLSASVVLLAAAKKITGSEVPGGDFKLLCSLGFTCGFRELAAVIFLAGIGAVVYGLINRLPVKRHIPLCSYVAPSYIALQIIAFAMERG